MCGPCEVGDAGLVLNAASRSLKEWQENPGTNASRCLAQRTAARAKAASPTRALRSTRAFQLSGSARARDCDRLALCSCMSVELLYSIRRII